MPRRPLCCPTCADLLEQLTKAGEAASAAGSRMTAAVGTKNFQPALQMRTEMRQRYLDIRERLRQHRELAHGYRESRGQTKSAESEAKQ
jgi:hypothetical protein